MLTVQSNQKTTLLLNFAWQPVTTITARAAFLHLLRGNICSLDRDSRIFHNIDTWNQQANFYEDQPALSSSQRIWPIPTVVVVTSRFFRRPKKQKLSVIDMARMYNHTCQYCLQKFPLIDLTIDHIKPRSKGGLDVHDNRTLACFQCNSKKSSHYPFLNIENKTVKAPQIPDFLINTDKVRKEWEYFLKSA